MLTVRAGAPLTLGPPEYTRSDRAVVTPLLYIFKFIYKFIKLRGYV